MGLDQYAYVVDGDKREEMSYWRKHNRLQGWMEELWRTKTKNETDDFNCVDLELDETDIDSLETDIDAKNLPETTGFFFGDDSYDDDYDKYDKEHDLEFITKAREAIKNGFKVVYSCWY